MTISPPLTAERLLELSFCCSTHSKAPRAVRNSTRGSWSYINKAVGVTLTTLQFCIMVVFVLILNAVTRLDLPFR